MAKLFWKKFNAPAQPWHASLRLLKSFMRHCTSKLRAPPQHLAGPLGRALPGPFPTASPRTAPFQICPLSRIIAQYIRQNKRPWHWARVQTLILVKASPWAVWRNRVHADGRNHFYGAGLDGYNANSRGLLADRIEHLGDLRPGHLLAVVDLTQIKQVALHPTKRRA